MKTSSYNCKTSWQPGSSWCVCVPVVRVCVSSVCLCLSQRFFVLFAWLCVCRVYLQFQQEIMGISDIWKFDLSEGCPLDIEVTAFSAYTGSWKARTGTQVFYLIIQVLLYLVWYITPPDLGSQGGGTRASAGAPALPRMGGQGVGWVGIWKGVGMYPSLRPPPRSWVSRDELSTSENA